MPDAEFNQACRTLAISSFPYGFSWGPNAPNTFEDLAAEYADKGRITVTDQWVAEEHPAFEDAFTYRAFRAWHDLAHLKGDHKFTLEGECGAADLQKRQLTALCGPEKANKWWETLHDELIVNNFGECATCMK